MVFNVLESSEREELTASNLPFEITKLENIIITLKDGCKLSAHIWIPKKALIEKEKFKIGSIVEYIPYRKNDFTAVRDSIRHPFFAGNGFASIRIDMRGTGDSDDWLKDEYLKQEQDDCLEVFDWIILQSWSNGSIGMFGKSWGGFNSLQVAARNHNSLKCIITLMSTDDRYSDDVHYRGGTLLASDMLWWASTMFAYNARPQDPKIVGSKWKENWLERLKTPPNVIEWVKHQKRDDYWKHGSICENYNDIKIPVLAIGGWRDGYTNPVFRMCEFLSNNESKFIIGPWCHEYPEVATPKPAIGFQQIALLWWKKYLSNEDEEIKLPKFTAYIQYPSDSIDESYNYRDGKWIGLKSYSSNFDNNNTIEKMIFNLNDTGLLDTSSTIVKDNNEDSILKFSGDQGHGLNRGNWCPFGQPDDLPTDQKLENSKCLMFKSKPFKKSIEFFGQPIVNLTISSDKKISLVSCRINDYNPKNNSSILISWGILNLSHRNSNEFPEYLIPNKKYKISIKLDVLGIKFEKGHILELSLSTTDWPQAWPTPEVSTISLYTNESELILPVLKTDEDNNDIIAKVELPPPQCMIPTKREILRKENRKKIINFNNETGEYIIDDYSDEGNLKLIKNGKLSNIEYGSINKNKWIIKKKEPLSAFNKCEWELNLGRDNDWQIKIITKSIMKCDYENFYLINELKGFESGGVKDDGDYDFKLIADYKWEDTIKRDFI